MSFSLALKNGDLVQQGSSFGVVYGVDKLVQDLTLWLTERYGGDIMHPEVGSVLDSWIGTIISSSTKADIHGEVLRVLQNYQHLQMIELKKFPQKFSMSEILYGIDDIQVSADYDTVSVVISVSTAPPESQIATIVATATTQ